MTWGRYVFALGVGAVVYAVLTLLVSDGPLLSPQNVRQFLIFMVVQAIMLSQTGRRAATPKGMLIVGVVGLAILGPGMVYLTYPFDTLDAVLPALFVISLPTAMIAMAVYRMRRDRSTTTESAS